MSVLITTTIYWIFYTYRFFKFCYNWILFKCYHNSYKLLSINYTYNSFCEKTLSLNNKNFTTNQNYLQFIQFNTHYLKRISTLDDINNFYLSNDKHSLLSNPNIMSVSLMHDDNDYEIDIKNFLVTDNILLDKPFLQWYMFKYYSLKDLDEYFIIIIDNDVKMHNLNSNNYIYLLKDNFIIKTI